MSSPSTPFEAFMKTLDVPVREAISHLMAEHQRQIEQLQASQAAYQAETTAKLSALGADVAALKQELAAAKTEQQDAKIKTEEKKAGTA